MNVFALLFVAAAGALNAAQSGANAQLVRSTERPWLVGLVVSLVTALALAVAWAVTGLRVPDAGRIAAAPWWAWTGGLVGGLYIVTTLFFAQPLGAGVFTGVTVTAGILASVVIDHFGWFGFSAHPATLLRVLGAAIMLGGLFLVSRF